MPNTLADLSRPPDPALIEAGAGGEKLVAVTRLVFWIFIGLAPLTAVLTGGRETPREIWIALAAVAIAIALSAWVVVILRRDVRVPTIGFITGAGDITVVTLTLLAVAVAGRPMVAIDSQAAWAVYLLGILATSLRYDFRICLFVGCLTVIEYVGLVLWVVSHWDIEVTAYTTTDTETTSLIIHVSRMMLMVAATALSVGIVYRSRQLVYASGTDRLTGLGNRAYFEARFRAELARASRAGDAVSLAILDLDHFKNFNDRWGHEAGDAALQLVARVMREESREEDVLARWGGEEMALVLPDTEIEGARRKVERIRMRLAGELLPIADQTAAVTISCGLAGFPADGTDAPSLFAVADRRLFAAKRTGRNRVVSDDELSYSTRPSPSV